MQPKTGRQPIPAYNKEAAAPIPAKPAVTFNANKNVFWGDLHIHTSYSTDAYTMGVRTTPDDAYTFTRGGEIAHGAGYGIKIKRPLDFAAVTDHSEYLGVLRDQQPELLLSKRSLRQRLLEDSRIRNTLFFIRSLGTFDLKDVDADTTPQASYNAWQDTIAAAERHYIPGVFSTFVAYEWSSQPDTRNLHRNVIYRDTHVPAFPYSSLESLDPRDLWQALESQREQGMTMMAIPHNGNVSDGLMYDAVAFDGKKMDAGYAQQRLRNEPLSEIFQVKGSSETHPELSPTDEFAGFEIYDTLLSHSFELSQPKGSYSRDALRLGLELSHREGFNPYQFGVIGASDGHNSSSPVEEDNYHGKLPLLDGSAGLRMATATFLPDDMPGGRRWSAAGLAGVWAEQNTRESIYDGMASKETYATSGPLITVRFFGGWDFSDQLPLENDWIATAYDTGVAMGNILKPHQEQLPENAPRFAIAASRDPDGANLDRIQIIKGWIDASGQSHEKVYEVVWSGERSIDKNTGKLSAVGNTVNTKQASYQNTIGASQLMTVWQDPDFSSEQQAFYYARVLEIPTPRWTTFDAKTLGIDAPEPSSIQERAVTSAIWYRP
ncbi:DUF3604 domain-containing protein [Oceanicoccus sp. KOV_DT_Chl]|uniref:DUF3604 domain-containing protein n=1 Tax=Oceanicoccus sp. KOV_DT_Chl TaxID=1904639 RepID=UPI000C7AAFAD|nr:DUF3604 domain-containing protein [Oceanicoccus sp. KOV_DT_Chl]